MVREGGDGDRLSLLIQVRQLPLSQLCGEIRAPVIVRGRPPEAGPDWCLQQFLSLQRTGNQRALDAGKQIFSPVKGDAGIHAAPDKGREALRLPVRQAAALAAGKGHLVSGLGPVGFLTQGEAGRHRVNRFRFLGPEG